MGALADWKLLLTRESLSVNVSDNKPAKKKKELSDYPENVKNRVRQWLAYWDKKIEEIGGMEFLTISKLREYREHEKQFKELYGFNYVRRMRGKEI